MKDTSGLYWNTRRKPISLSWVFAEDGSPLILTILPHDHKTPPRMVIFEQGRATYHVIHNGPFSDSTIRRIR